jgi:hypothetical protein
MIGVVRNRQNKQFSCSVGERVKGAASPTLVDDDRQSFSTESHGHHGTSFAQIGADIRPT